MYKKRVLSPLFSIDKKCNSMYNITVLNDKRRIPMKRVFILSAILLLTVILSTPLFAAAGDNICLNAEIVNASGYVNEEETPRHMIDGDINTKWYSEYDPVKVSEIYQNGTVSVDTVKHVLTIDFGENKFFNKYAMFQTSLCERDYGSTYANASAWIIEASTDGTTWFKIDEVSNNTLEITEREIELTEARYIRLAVIKPQQEDGSIVRIPELQIYESDSQGTVTESESLEALKQMQEEAEKAEARAKAEEKLVLILIIIGMVISLGVLYTLKFTAYMKEKGAK